MNKLARWIYNHLGDEWGGGASPPGSAQKLEFGEIDGWLAHYDDEYARRLAWFILWDWWAVATWFGLKRKIWYWALHVIVTDNEPIAKRAREAHRANPTR